MPLKRGRRGYSDAADHLRWRFLLCQGQLELCGGREVEAQPDGYSQYFHYL